MEDLLLKEKGGASVAPETMSVEDVLLSWSLTHGDLDGIGERLSLVYQANGSARNGASMLRGALFALSSRPMKNPEWREHAASSFREILHEWRTGAGSISTAFCKAFKPGNDAFPNMSTHGNEYKRLSCFYDYFSEICHHNATNILYRLQALYGPDIKAGDDTSEMFLRAAGDFIREMKTMLKP